MTSRLPDLRGILTGDDVVRTAATIAGVQRHDGSIPFAVDQHVDVWNHVEAAMALLVAGDLPAVERAYEWCLATQRADGSWPLRFGAGDVEDASGETNMSAYLAVGVWHHWLIRRDTGFVRRYWPAVHRGLDFVVGMQLPFGGIAWSQEPGGKINEEALLAASSSIYQSLRAGLALSELADEPQPEWELAAARLQHALRSHRDRFLDKSRFSMDWYYPVLGGAVRGPEAATMIAEGWDRFVRPGLGILCVDTNPWVTGAETCELVLALDAIGDRRRALRLLEDMQHLRSEDGAYWTGYVYPDEANWPVEHTTYTAAAVILAYDALAGATAGSGIFRGAGLPAGFSEIGLGCGCAPATAELAR